MRRSLRSASWLLAGSSAASFAAALAVALTGCSSSAKTPAPPRSGAALEVATDRGLVVGKRGEGVRQFFNIPYAAPPVGELRWQPPAAAAAWAGKRDATRLGPACPQPEEGFHRETSEDCLSLNLWVPDATSGSDDDYGKLPVLLWIHGGAFYQGSGTDDLYDGARLARRARAIVVTINYRLGALGFFSHAALASAQGMAALPSVGLLDQRAAMQWVQRNIAAFGGDPANVTLDGESAGAWSIYSQLAMPDSRGLFARAIVQSGATADALYFTADEANAQGEQLAAKLGCSPPGATDAAIAACLRGKTTDELVHALPYRRGLLLQPGVWWGPTVDGVELPRQPLEAIRTNQFARVPLLLGTALDEGALHTAFLPEVKRDEVAWFLATTFNEAIAARVLSRFDDADTRDWKAALSEVVSYGIFRCNARRTARAAAARGVAVYLYVWTHALDGPPRISALGATHGIDLFFTFGNATAGIGPSPAEQPLVDLTQDLWGNFARTGDPGEGWPRYTAETDAHFVLDQPSSTGAHLDADICDFWDSISAD